MKRVFLPFDLPVYTGINSNHPLPVSLTIPAYDGIEFVRPQLEAPPPASAAQVCSHAAALADRLLVATAGRADLPANAVLEFISSRDLASQLYVDPAADLAFFHTAPVLLDQLPWILHIESITPLFNPSIYPGLKIDQPLRSTAIFWLVRAMLESPHCRAIFTNLSLTVDQIHRVFASEIISRKTRHVPAGPYFSPDEARQVEAAIGKRRDREEVVILFTNSWHQQPASFLLRGGMELVMAFLAIENEFPNVRLVLRTVWPDVFEGAEVTRRVRSHPRIRLLDSRLSDAEMLTLFADADIFALDAAAVHSISLLRAMYCGAACVISDVPGYEDYVDDQTAVIVPGRRAAIYSEEPGSGWLKDDYAPMYSVNPDRVGLLAGILAGLCRDRTRRQALGMNARRRVLTRNSFDGWAGGFEALLRDVLAAGR